MSFSARPLPRGAIRAITGCPFLRGRAPDAPTPEPATPCPSFGARECQRRRILNPRSGSTVERTQRPDLFPGTRIGVDSAVIRSAGRVMSCDCEGGRPSHPVGKAQAGRRTSDWGISSNCAHGPVLRPSAISGRPRASTELVLAAPGAATPVRLPCQGETVEPQAAGAPVTDATHRTYQLSEGRLRGSVLLGLTLMTWYAVSRRHRRGPKVVTENCPELRLGCPSR